MLRLPRILHVEVHKVLSLPRILRVNKQVNTLITMEGRTGDHRRQPHTTADNATPTASNGAWRFTKCCACHEFWCTSRCVLSQSAAPATNSARGGSNKVNTCACYELEGWTKRTPPTYSNRQPQTTQRTHRPLTEQPQFNRRQRNTHRL